MCGCILCNIPKIKKLNKNIIENTNLSSENISTQLNSSNQIFPPSISIDDFQSLKLLGKGSFGKVILVKYFENDKIYAMKILTRYNSDIIRLGNINRV